MKLMRNAPCPCGSGKKYKHCCLKPDRARGSASEARIRQAAARARAWEADIVPFATRFEDDPTARPANVLVIAEGLVIFSDVLARPSAEVDDVAAELQRGIFEAATRVGAWPPAVEVRESEVATALARRIRDGGSPIPVRAGSLPGVDEATAAINQATGRSATTLRISRPDLWAGWGQPEEWIAEMFGVAAAFYRARPWQHLDELPPVVAAMPDGRSWYLAIMGSAEIQYGLTLHSDPDDPRRMFNASDGVPDGRVLCLSFGDGSKLWRLARREIARSGWEVASAAAYPALLTIGTPAGGLRRVDAGDLVAVLAAVTAWTEAIDRDRTILSAGPWRHPMTGVELVADGCGGAPG